MSLKAFHIVFIALSILLAFVFTAWEINGFIETGESLQLVGGVISCAVGVFLILYVISFLRKLRNVH